MILKARIATLVFAAVAVFSAATMLAARAGADRRRPLAEARRRDQEAGRSGFCSSTRGRLRRSLAKLFPEPGENPEPGLHPLHRRPQERADARPSVDPRHETRRPQIRRRHRPRSARWQGLQRGHDAGPRQGHAHAARLSRVPFLGKDEIWYRLPDSGFKQVDPAILAKYVPERVETKKGKAKAPPKRQAPAAARRLGANAVSARRRAACRRAGISADRPRRRRPASRSADAGRSSGRSIRPCR